MKETEYQYPSEEVKLPSKGLLYPKDSPLRKGFIEMKYMTAKEEDILSNANFIQNGTVIDKLLKSLITSPINYNELLAGDKNALLVAARILGYGPEYEFSFRGEKLSIDLSSLKDKEHTCPHSTLPFIPNSSVYLIIKSIPLASFSNPSST